MPSVADLRFEQVKPLTLRIVDGGSYPEEVMFEIADWCNANHCGVRTSWDMFRFVNSEQITLFLLRWSS
jgi:hypothetical protein